MEKPNTDVEKFAAAMWNNGNTEELFNFNTKNIDTDEEEMCLDLAESSSSEQGGCRNVEESGGAWMRRS